MSLTHRLPHFTEGESKAKANTNPCHKANLSHNCYLKTEKMLDPDRQWILQETSFFLFALQAYLALAKYQTLPGLGVQARTIVSWAQQPTFIAHQPRARCCAGCLRLIILDSFIHTSGKHFPICRHFHTCSRRCDPPQILSNVLILCQNLSKATQLGGTDPESESGPSHFKALPSPTLLVLWASFQIINMCQHFSVLSQDILSPEFPTIFLFPSGQCLQLTRKRQQRSNQVWDSFLPGLDYCRSRGPRKLSKPFSTEENSSSWNLCPHGPPTDLELKL